MSHCNSSLQHCIAVRLVAGWALRILAAWALLADLIYLLALNRAMDLDWWRGYILVALLPALAAVHLIYLSTRSRTIGATMA